MKNLEIVRKAYIYGDHILLSYSFVMKNWKCSFKDLSVDVFPSLEEEEIRKIFKELESFVEIKEYIGGLELEAKVKKDKEEVKRHHRNLMKTIKKVFDELKRKEKKKKLEGWLWREKIFNL